MKVSLNTIKQYVDFELPAVDELVARINSQLGGVEEVIDLGAKYKDAVIVKVVKCEKHPNADKLSVCEIDAGTGENVQVVCGAPNVRVGMLTVWLPPKSIVPASWDDKEPFVLEARELRGVVSNGMLAAGDELAINNDHEGIIEIIEADILQGVTLQDMVGRKFAEVFGLDDTIIDIENKMFTHRPDCFGQLGVAREIAGILGHKFTSPKWYLDEPKFEQTEGLELEVFNDAPEKVPRFMAVALKNIEVKPSPLWLQCALVVMGSKPINNIVDVTNYIMLLTAQPTHAYDYDKLRGGKLGARLAKKGEKATLLNGKTYELTDEDIVIADGEGVIGLGGIMGGLDSEVTSETKNIVLECANFDMYTLRRSSMRHGLFTDALTRFNKGQSPLQNDRIINLLMMSIKDVSPDSKQASAVFDPTIDSSVPNSLTDFAKKYGYDGPKSTSCKFINDRLGLELSRSEIMKLLTNVEVESYDDASRDDDEFYYSEPFWRTDIEIPEDIVEEVGRLYGFDKLPRELPKKSIKPAAKNELFELKSQIRRSLSKAGANEVLTYSFVNENLLKKVGQNPENAFKINNALSPNLQYYRPSLTPSLLDKVHMNIKAGHDEFALFEIGKGHIVGQNGDDDLPREDELLALVIAASDSSKKSGTAYYQARKYLTDLLNTKPTLQPVPDDAQEFDITKPYDVSRSAFVYVNDKFIGIIGEFRASVKKALKLPKYCAGFELDTGALLDILGQDQYVPLPRFPSVTQDITLKVPAKMPYQELFDFVWGEIARIQPTNTLPSLGPVSIYQSDDDKSYKNITFRLKIASYERTLKADEVNNLLDTVANSAKTKFESERL